MREYFRIRWSIFTANTINTFHQETAYFANNWGGLLSTVFYTATLLLFINILYSNISIFAGYNKNTMMLLVFISQLSFYIAWFWSNDNLTLLYESVRDGKFDLVLVKPVPAEFFSVSQKISILVVMEVSLPNLILLATLIKWSQLPLNIMSCFFGALIFLFGQIIWHCFRFLFYMPVFWYGEAKRISSIPSAFESSNIPFEGFNGSLRFIFTIIIPVLLVSQLSVSVVLGKSNGPKMFLLSLIVAIIFLILKSYFWKKALKNYTSASS